MIDAAHWFSKHYLLGIWKEPNYIHLISTADYVAATKAAILSPTASGIYHLGDEGVAYAPTMGDADVDDPYSRMGFRESVAAHRL